MAIFVKILIFFTTKNYDYEKTYIYCFEDVIVTLLNKKRGNTVRYLPMP